MALRERIVVDDRDALRRLEAFRHRLRASGDAGASAFQQIRRSAKDAEDSVERFGKRSQNVVSRLKTQIASLVSSFALLASARFFIRANADVEQLHVFFETMLKSGARARALIAELVEFAATTPYELPEVANSARQLLAYGEAAQNIPLALRRIGDVASATGTRLEDLVSIYGKVRQKGQLYSMELLQFAGRGVPIVAALADVFGVAESEVRKLVESGRVGFPELQKAFQVLTEEGGRFEGMMEKQSTTFNSLIANLSDDLTTLGVNLTSGFFAEVKRALSDFASALSRFESDGTLDAYAARISSALRRAAVAIRDVITALVNYAPTILRVTAALVTFRVVSFAVVAATRLYAATVAAARIASLAYAAASAVVAGNATRAAAAVRLLNASVAASPIGLLATAVASIAALFITFKTRTEDATSALRDQYRQIRENIAALRDLSGEALLSQRNQYRTRADLAFETLTTSGTRITAIRERIDEIRDAARARTPLGVNPTAQLDYTPAESAEIARLRREETVLLEEQGRASAELIVSRRTLAAVEDKIASDYDAQIADLRQQEEQILRNKDISRDAAREMIADLRLRREALEKERDAARGQGGGGGGGDEDEADPRRQLEIRQLQELQSTYGSYRELLTRVHREEQELLRLKSLRKDATPQEIAALNALIATRERDLTVARSLLGPLDRLEKVQARGLRSLKPLEQYQQRLTNATSAYELALARLANQRDRNLVSEEDHAAAAKRATDTYLASLREIYNQAQSLGLISPDLERAFRAAFDAAERPANAAKKSVDDLVSSLSNVAAAVRSLTTLGRVFSGLSDDTERFISGLADAADNLSRLLELREKLAEQEKLSTTAGVLALAVPAVGIAAGVVSMITSLFGGSSDAARRRDEEMKRLTAAIRDNVIALNANTAAAFSGGRVGAGLSESQLRDALGQLAILDRFANQREPGRGNRGEQRRQLSVDDARAALAAIAALGIPGAEDYRRLFDQLLDKGISAQEAIARILEGRVSDVVGGRDVEGLDAYLRRLLDSLGDFTGDVAGAISLVRNLTRYLGADAQDAFDRFLEYLLDSVSGLAPELRDLLAGLEGIDLSSEEGRAKIREIVAAIAALSPSLFADGTLEQILDQLLDFADKGGSDGSADSNVIARTITEVQADRVVSLLETLVSIAERIADAVAPAALAQTGSLYARTLAAAPQTPAASRRLDISVAATVTQDAPMTPLQRDQLVDAVARELERRIETRRRRL